MIVVSNASPIIFLLKLKKLHLLKHLFSKKILLPKQVHEEICKKLEDYEERYLDSCQKLFTIVDVKDADSIYALDYGEASVIMLAKRRKAAVVLLDDKQARIIAEALGLSVLGTIGILFKLVEKRKISRKELEDIFQELIQEHGFRISIELYDLVLRRVRGFNKGYRKV